MSEWVGMAVALAVLLVAGLVLFLLLSVAQT